MIQLRHTGIYVNNLNKMVAFYKYVFEMIAVVEDFYQCDDLVQELLENGNAKIKITKLITEQGKVSGFDDMVELIEIISPDNVVNNSSHNKIFYRGCMHIAFAIPNIEAAIDKIKTMGGSLITNVHSINNKRCCFAIDIEGNYIELIENIEA